MPGTRRLWQLYPQTLSPSTELDYRPPQPWPGSATPPDIVDLRTFTDVHSWADIKIVNYLVGSRPNHSATAHPDVLYTLQPSRAFELPANNATARIAFAEICLAHVLAAPAIAAGPLNFVTITSTQHAFPVGDRRVRFPADRETNAQARRDGLAARFNVIRLQKTACQALEGIPFIGMVEPALFRRWGPNGRTGRDWVSWHCHLITWGAIQSVVSRRLAPLRDNHDSMLENVAAAHVEPITPGDVHRKLVYMLKAPQKLYRVEYFKEPWTNPRTGEFYPPGWHVNKDWLRTGDRIRLLDVMGGRTLDALLFGLHTGTTLVGAIRAEALAPFRAWEARQPWMQQAEAD